MNIYQYLYLIATTGIGAVAIKKGTDFCIYIFQLLAGHDMPGRAKATLSLVIALTAPPAAYAILLVDSGLVKFSFDDLAAVTALGFMSA